MGDLDGQPDRLEERLNKIERELRELKQRIARLEPHEAAEARRLAEPSAEDKVRAVIEAIRKERQQEATPAVISSEMQVDEPPVEIASTPAPLPSWFEQVEREEESAQRADLPVSPLAGLAARLRELGVLPPESTGNLEVQIGAWWMTRIGMLLGVIGVVSFGIYMSQFSRPPLRLAELVFFSLAITAAGWKLGRKLPRFGEVIFAGGLALLYFAAFGAYAVEPIKVITNPLAGLYVQLAAIAAIVVIALVMNSEPLATLAVAFGLVAGLFSVHAGLELSALMTAAVLEAGAIYLLLSRAWYQPLSIAIFGVWAVYAATFWLHLRTGARAGYEPAIGYLACVMAAAIATDWVAFRLNKIPPHRVRIAMQYFNTSGALALAMLVTLVFYRARLESTYFVFGALLLAASVVYYATNANFNLMHGFFIKATALITLGVMTHFQGNARWIALAAQSGVLLASAWRTRLKITEGAMIAVWAASLAFLMQSLVHLRIDSTLILQQPTAMAIAWLAISASVLGLYGRLFDRPDGESRNEICMALGVFLGVGAIVIGLKCVSMPWQAMSLAMVAAALAVFALAPRHWLTVVAALPPLAMAHVAMWNYVYPKGGGGVAGAWANESVVVALTFAAAVGLNLAARRNPSIGTRKDIRQTIVFAHLLSMLTILAVPYDRFGLEAWMLAGVALAWAATGLSFIEPIGLPTRIAFAPMIYTLALIFFSHHHGRGMISPAMGEGQFLYLAMLGGFAHLAATWRLSPIRKRIEPGEYAGPAQGLHLAATVLIVHVALNHLFDAPDLVWMYGLAAAAFGALAWVARMQHAPIGAVYFIAAGHLACYGRGLSYTLIWPGVTIALLTLAAAPAFKKLPDRPSPELLRKIQWTAAIAALLLFDLLMLRQFHTAPALAHYITPLWGVAGLAVVAAGFLDRAKPLRIVGLAGLAICIPRVFVYDIRSMLYRIAAFLLLGAALLAVGFIYNKYQKVIDKMDSE
ncbi:DUF2339 domain-containing protein [bacterium]|nr:DUF2339 domain-containing protein [bacterium]